MCPGGSRRGNVRRLCVGQQIHRMVLPAPAAASRTVDPIFGIFRLGDGGPQGHCDAGVTVTRQRETRPACRRIALNPDVAWPETLRDREPAAMSAAALGA